MWKVSTSGHDTLKSIFYKNILKNLISTNVFKNTKTWNMTYEIGFSDQKLRSNFSASVPRQTNSPKRIMVYGRCKFISTNPYGKLPFLAEKKTPYRGKRQLQRTHVDIWLFWTKGFFQPNWIPLNVPNLKMWQITFCSSRSSSSPQKTLNWDIQLGN